MRQLELISLGDLAGGRRAELELDAATEREVVATMARAMLAVLLEAQDVAPAEETGDER